MLSLYTFLFRCALGSMWVLSPFSKRIRKFQDRKSNIAPAKGNKKRILVHCASLGEYNQALSVCNKLHQQGYDVIVSFFSPSGYDVKISDRDKCITEYVYLPVDLPEKCAVFLKEINPDLVVMVKYEFWYNFIDQCRKLSIPFIWIGMHLEPQSKHLKWPTSILFKSISYANHLFAQNEGTANLLSAFGIASSKMSVAGDPRIATIVEEKKDTHIMNSLANATLPLIIYGSVYKDDILMIKQVIEEHADKLHIVVPHKVDHENIQHFLTALPNAQVFNSENIDAKVSVVSTIGLLRYMYQNAQLAYIGGGFQHGIHNCLEPLAYEIPIIIGPKREGFAEINELNDSGYIEVINSRSELVPIVNRSLEKKRDSSTVQEYFKRHSNSSSKIVDYISNLLNV